ncbi:protein kinase [Candidatus Uabimicrobium sp. HlEnr_7]|uniref:protein kinase domain-containing protein n=1 Tax=Candidatus Uabimicrobium helgolandensis TaxID=3095367 RepID=UPI0035582760
MPKPVNNPFKISINQKEDPVNLKAGDIFNNKLEIISKIGQGGMGIVYLARDRETERHVALKLIQGQEIQFSQKQRFLKEIKALAQLQHPNIVQLFHFDYEPQEHYTFEYVKGDTLDGLINNDDWFKLAQIFQIIFQTIHVVHQQGIIHRDLKPSNIMIDNTNQPKIMDFGLAKLANNNHTTNTASVLGSLAYMSPEQVQGRELDLTTDIYSLGATFYQILSGRPPFQGNNVVPQILYSDPIEPRKLKPNIPVELEAICLKCLEKNSKYRYKNAQQTAQDLHNFILYLPISAKTPSTITRMRKFFMRNKAICSLTIISVVIFVFTLFWYTYSLHQEQLKTLSAKSKEEKAKLMAQQQAQTEQLRSTKIALFLADRAANEQNWQECGALVCKGLEFISTLHTSEANILRKEAYELLYLALRNFRCLWRKKNFFDSKVVHKRYIRNFCFSPNNKILASVGQDGQIFLWQTTTGKKIFSFRSYSQMLALTENRPPFFFDSDDTFCYVSPKGEFVSVFIPQRKITKTKMKVELPIQSLVVDNNKVAILEFSSKNLVVYNHKNQSYQKLASQLKNIKFDLYKNLLVVASFTKKDVEIWDLNENKIISRFYTEHFTEQVVINDTYAIIADTKSSIKIWSTTQKKLLYTINKDLSKIHSLAFANGDLIIVADKIYAWNIKKNKLHFVIDRRKYRSPVLGGDYLACANETYQGIQLWDVANDKVVMWRKFSHLSNFLVTPNENLFVFHKEDKKIYSMQQTIYTVGNQTETIFIPENMVSMSKDFINYIATDYCDGGVFIFSHNFASRQTTRILSFESLHKMKNFPRLSARESLLAYIKDDLLCFLDINTQKVLPSIKTKGVKEISLSPKGNFIAAVHNNKIQIWNILSRKKVLEIKEKRSVSLHQFSMSGSIYTYKTSDDTLFVWNVLLKKYLGQIVTSSRIISNTIHPNNKLIALCLQNRIEIWDIKERCVVYEILHIEDFDLKKISFNDKGTKLFFHSQKPETILGYYQFSAKSFAKNSEFNPYNIFSRDKKWLEKNASTVSQMVFNRFVDEKLEVKDCDYIDK